MDAIALHFEGERWRKLLLAALTLDEFVDLSINVSEFCLGLFKLLDVLGDGIKWIT